MQCPFCHYLHTRVISTRKVDRGTGVRRRRACLACGGSFVSYEGIEVPELQVRKRDDTLEAYDPGKLEVSIIRASKRRPLAEDRGALGTVLNKVQRQVLNYRQKIVASQELARFVVEALGEVDEVASRRFAFTGQLQAAERLPHLDVDDLLSDRPSA